jgi:hypothetical protein
MKFLPCVWGIWQLLNIKGRIFVIEYVLGTRLLLESKREFFKSNMLRLIIRNIYVRIQEKEFNESLTCEHISYKLMNLGKSTKVGMHSYLLQFNWWRT